LQEIKQKAEQESQEKTKKISKLEGNLRSVQEAMDELE